MNQSNLIKNLSSFLVQDLSVKGLNSTMRQFLCESYPGCRLQAIIMNSLETVSADSQFPDKLYFEPLTIRRRDERYQLNNLRVSWFSLVVKQYQLGRAHCLKLVKILGTQVADLDRAEDRDLLNKPLKGLGCPTTTRTNGDKYEEEAVETARKIGFPVLVRHHTFGGRAMKC